MKLISTVLKIGTLVGVGILIERWRQQRLLEGARGDDQGAMGAEVTDAVIVGVMEVDPEPMTQISGEGIDPDMPTPPGARGPL